MVLATLFSSVPHSADHVNFKIKPLNVIFEKHTKEEKAKRGSYPPPVIPKMENKDGM